jgi:hypothetical protein
MNLLAYKRNVYSQNGEDGIIEEIFKRMGIKNGNFIEFGAWDGKHLSNSYKLLNEGWTGIFIEGDSNKFRDLLNNFSHNTNVTCLNTYVGYSEIDNLDNIIENSNHKNKDFDFISIDVDGLDYFIFNRLNRYLPKVICIEVSSGHRPDFSIILDESIAKNNVGQSLQVMINLASQKGYFPVCYSGNLFLVKNEYKELFSDISTNIYDIYDNFLQYIVGPDLDLTKYLYSLYCTQEGILKQKGVFGYIFPENHFLKYFCESKFKN